MWNSCYLMQLMRALNPLHDSIYWPNLAKLKKHTRIRYFINILFNISKIYFIYFNMSLYRTIYITDSILRLQHNKII